MDTSIWSPSTGAVYTVSGGELFIDKGSIYTINPILTSPKGYAFEAKVNYTKYDEGFSGLNTANADGTQPNNLGENALSYIMTSGAVNIYYIYAYGADGVDQGYDFISRVSSYTINIDYIIGFRFGSTSGVYYYVMDPTYNVLGSAFWSDTWSDTVSNNVFIFFRRL